MTVHNLNLSQIEVQERHRKKFAPFPLFELKRSILLPSGLLNPITVREVPETATYILVAGERRLRSIIEIYKEEKEFCFAGLSVPKGTIPAIICDPALTDIDIFEAELDENLRREDLTWQERVSAISELHELRKTQNPTQTYADTSRELLSTNVKKTDAPAHPEESRKHSATRVANAELIAAHLDDENVAGAQSERDALRIITQKLERQFLNATPQPVSKHTLYCADFRTVNFSPNQFSLVITDPPYGLGIAQFGDAANLRHEYTEDDYLKMHEDLIRLLSTICTDDAHIYLFCDIDHFHTIAEQFRTSEWRVRRAPLIWSKTTLGHLSEGDVYGFRRSYEFILHARRGDRSYKSLIQDVIAVTTNRTKQHAAEKPAELYTILMRLSAYNGEHVLDPFAGSGPIFAAAESVGCIATGCEISEKFAEYIEATYRLKRVPA